VSDAGVGRAQEIAGRAACGLDDWRQTAVRLPAAASAVLAVAVLWIAALTSFLAHSD